MTAAPRLACALLLSLAALPARAAEDEGWTRFLPELAPAMVACLQGEAGAAASAALPMNHGRALVRLERADGERLECVAELGAPGQPARRESLRPLGAAPPLPGEDNRRFTLARPCAGARGVEIAGRTLGWLSLAGCR